MSIHCEKSILTEHGAEPDPDHVQSLEEALELYYGKYKSQRHARNELRDVNFLLTVKILFKLSSLKVVKGLKAKISDQGQDYEELRATLEKERTQMEQVNWYSSPYIDLVDALFRVNDKDDTTQAPLDTDVNRPNYFRLWPQLTVLTSGSDHFAHTERCL